MDSNPYLSGIESYSPSKPSSYSRTQEDANIQGYLSNLSKAEQADYNTIVGGSTFNDYSKHPGVIGVTTKEGPSTAAGRYQITKTTYDRYAKKLGITDFSPESQDKIALELIKDNNALEDVKQGNYQAANAKLGGIWASLPSSKYNQPKRSSAWVEENFDTAPSKNPYLDGSFKATDVKAPESEPENPYLKGLARPSSNPYLSDVSTDSESDISKTRSFLKSAGGSAAIGIGATPTMVAGAELGATGGAIIGGPVGGVVGGIAGGLAGFIGGAKAIEAGFDMLPDSMKEVIGYDPKTRQKEIEANPETSFIGQLSGNLVLFRPGTLKDIVLEGGKRITPLMQRIGMGTAGGLFEAGNEKLAGENLNAQRIAEAAGFTAIAAKPTAYTRKVNEIVGEKLGNVIPRFNRSVDEYAKTRQSTEEMGANEWTSRWAVPDTTETGVPIRLAKIVDAEGNQAVQKDGKPVIARHYRNEDGTSKEIVMDLDEALSRFEDKPWVKAGLDENAFKTPYEYAQFILKHEDEHTRLSFEDWKAMQDPQGDLFKNDPSGVYSEEQMRKDYEHYINRQAYHSVQEDVYISQPDVEVPRIPKDAAENETWIGDALYALGKAEERDTVIDRARREMAQKDGVSTDMQQRWRAYAEGTAELDPRELDLFKKYAGQELQEIKRLTKYSNDKGWTMHEFIDPAIVGEFAPRIIIPKQGNKWQRILDIISKGEYGGFDQALTARPGALRSRNVFAGELPNGKRVMLQQGSDGSVYQWVNGKPVPFAKISEVGMFKPGQKVKNALIKQATEAEIEAQTPMTYEKDFQGVIYQRLQEVRKFIRTNKFLEDLTKSEWMKENARLQDGKSPPEGYRRPKHLDRIPQFDGYVFKDNIASMIEDFAKSSNPNALTSLSGALIKNMMLNPLPHMMNEGWHLYNARGLTGWVTPAGIYRFARTGMSALRSVLTQDAAYQKTLLEGGSLLSTKVRNNVFSENLFNKANKEFSQTPEFQSLAKRMGMKPLQLYDAISKKANIAMWTVRDMMYMQLINEKMRYQNMTRKEAIIDTERHMPSYRIPHKVMGSRAMSEVLQNPNVTVFSRYHYGLVNSLKNTAMDLAAARKGQAGLSQFLHGADTAAAIAVAIAVLYPLQDMIAQYITGNEDAKVRRAGPYHIFHALHGVASLEKDPMAVVSSFFTFNPALLQGAQLIANRKLYNGQPIYNPEDGAEKIWGDITNYTISTVPQVSQALKAQKEEDEGFKNWLARQIDVESPTMETVIKREKMVQRKESAGPRRTMKWEVEQED
jgi:muramidase (phage lysozyme)